MDWSADLDYAFTDKNGMGWVTTRGTSTLVIAIAAGKGSLRIAGKKRVVDALLTAGDRGSPDLEGSAHDSQYDHRYELLDVAQDGRAVAFRFALPHEEIVARCVPIQLADLPRSDLFECTFTGFRWRPVPTLPELHHSVIVGSDGPRVLNSLSGSTRKECWKRVVIERSRSR